MDGVGGAFFDQVGFVDQIWGRDSNFSCMNHNVSMSLFFVFECEFVCTRKRY